MIPIPPHPDAHLIGKLAEHDALWHQLEHGERVDRPEDLLNVYHLAFGRYLKQTGRVTDQ